jgi:hypothetical protein
MGLFPLSLALPRGALLAELILIALAFAMTLVSRLRKRGEHVLPTSPPEWDPVATALLGAVVLIAALFAALDLRYNLGWDAFQIWASKAQLLFQLGGLERTWYPGDTYELRHIAYPPLVPLYEALLAVVRGQFDFDSFKPVFLPFYFSLLVATYGAARGVVSRRQALAATLLVGLLPLLSTGTAASGYADMPQAAFVAGVTCAAFRRGTGPSALPWLIGGLTTVKAEGTILALVATAGVTLFWMIDRPPGLRARLRAHWGAVAVTVGLLGLRFAYLRWAAAPDVAYASLDAASLSTAIHRVPHVARLCMVKMLSPRRWGLFWVAFFSAAVVLAIRGTSRERCLVLATAAASAVLATPFLFSTWPLELHIDQAYGRLLSQLAPAAAVAILIGYRRAQVYAEPAT